MAEVTKYQLIPNNNFLSDFKTHFSLFKTRKSSAIVYGVVVIFVVFTVVLAFSPSSSFSNPWFVNIFTLNYTSSFPSFSDESYRSHFSPIFSHLSPNSTQNPNSNQISETNFSRSLNLSTFQVPMSNNSLPSSKNLTKTQFPTDKVEIFKPNNSTPQGKQSSEYFSPNSTQNPITNQISETNFSRPLNLSTVEVPMSNNSLPSSKNLTKAQFPPDKVEIFKPNNSISQEKQSNNSSINMPQISPKTSPVAASLSKKESNKNGNDSVSGEAKKKGLIGSLVDCDLYDGEWVRDDSYPLYKPGSCKLIDEQFNCILNGRPDNDYQKLKWKPKDCTLPRLNGRNMLKLLKGKRLVFVGDSLNRNMWESLVCILKNSVKRQKNVYEAFGRHYFRTEASYSFVFKDYNCTVEFFVSPFLVQQWEIKDKNGTTKETLRLDVMVRDSDQFKNADFIVFNTGHWWTHEKTSKGEDYYQEGNHVHKQLDVVEAFRRALTTWAKWVDANIDPQRTQVLFRGYSTTHFRGGRWNSGGQCDGETEPIKKDTYLTKYPWKMKVFESVINAMKTPVSYLNVTRMTDYRKDGHPSIYRKQHLSDEERKSPLRFQDCSHWCLPGVPDMWNELLYAELLRKQYKDQQQKNTT